MTGVVGRIMQYTGFGKTGDEQQHNTHKSSQGSGGIFADTSNRLGNVCGGTWYRIV